MLTSVICCLRQWELLQGCACVFTPTHHWVDWASDSTSGSTDVTSNSCSISQFLSLSLLLRLPCHSGSTVISVQASCPLSQLNIQWCLSDTRLTGLSNAWQPMYTHIPQKQYYSLLWPRPLGWVNISIIYHKSPTTHRGPSRRGIVRVVI